VELNALGVGFERRDEAQVLFTTQAKLLHLSRFRPNFAYNENFHYLGVPRQVRIWDESILPIDTLTLAPEQIETVADWLFNIGQYEHAILTRDFAHVLRGKAHDSIVKVPALPPLKRTEEEERGIIIHDPGSTTVRIFGAVMVIGEGGKLRPATKEEAAEFEADEAEREALEQAWSILTALGGREVRVYRDEHSGAVMISSRDVLPRLFAPLLVLDANADKRAIYRQWRASVGLHHLYSPKKTYHNLTIHFADLRAGKEAHRNSAHRLALVEAAVAAFEEALRLGADRVLFLYNKPEKPSQDMRKLIRKEIKKRGDDPDQADFLTWGMHKATNDFRHVKHVVAVGVMQAPLYEITALARGVGRVPVHRPIDRQKVEEVRQSEILHTLFQGVGRSAVRKTVNGDVPEGCHLWLIASPRGHMHFPRERLPEWFPGSHVEDWDPFPCKLRGGRHKTDARPPFVDALLAKRAEPCIRVTDFEGFDPQQAQRFLNEEDIKSCLRSRGYALTRRKGPGRGVPYCYSLEAEPRQVLQ
jgi:hypothetical protein